MTKNIDDLKAALFAAKDGGAACDAINALAKLADKGNDQAKAVLALYVRDGQISHMRTHACSCLVESANEPHADHAALFRETLSDPDLRYWSILGFIRSAGREAYEELARMAGDKSIPLDDRAQAIKCLAEFSRQPFDRNLPADPGLWKASQLRLAEIHAWADDGYPDGQGYSTPTRDAALDAPRTAFEKVVSRLDKKLARQRRARQDPADPTDWLAVAAPEDIQRISARWQLPAVYLDFLTRFSPINVIIESRRFDNGFQFWRC